MPDQIEVDLIGYISTYYRETKNNYIYYFFPKLIRDPLTGEWDPCDHWNNKSFRLNFYYAEHEPALFHREIVHIAHTGLLPEPVELQGSSNQQKWDAKLDARNFKISPAAEVSFVPVLSCGNSGASVVENISLTPDLKRSSKFTDPIYISGQALLQDDGFFYGPLPAEALVENTAASKDSCNAPLRLKNGGKLWSILDDYIDYSTSNLETGSLSAYTFPKYVFLSDLEPASGRQEPEPAPSETAPPSGDAAPEPDAAPTLLHLDRKELVDHLCTHIQAYRPNYSRNEILSIAISMTQNFLTVFSGEPGTGKTSICNIFAQVLGLRDLRNGQRCDWYVSVPVERGWTSKRDFIGYYNPLSDSQDGNSRSASIVPANAQLYQSLRRAEAEERKELDAHPLLILLDEANLSPMEYYWSDFIRIAGADGEEEERTINLGGRGDTGELRISEACRFVATINNDHTTQPLSPRIIDRAAVVSLPGGEFAPGKKLHLKNDRFPSIAWESLRDAFGSKPDRLNGQALDLYTEIKALLKPLGVTVSYRAEEAVQRFWSAAHQEGMFAEDDPAARDIAALDYAVAQRLLPKLSGSGAAFRDSLDRLQSICKDRQLEKCSAILERIILRGGEDNSALNYYSFF